HRPLVAEREAEGGQQGLGFLVGLRAGGDADVHATHSVDLVVFDFGENDLFLYPDVVVATAIECTARHATEVTNARQRDRDQAVEEFVHAAATQGHHATDRVVFTDLETGNSLAGLGDNRLLAGDLGEIAHSVLDDLAVGHRLRHTHVEGDLGNAGHFHHALVAKLGLQVANDLAVIKLLQTSHVLRPLRLRTNDGAVGAENSDFLAVDNLNADAVALAGGRVVQRHIGNVDGHGLVDDAAGGTRHGVALDVLLDDIDAFDQHVVGANAAQHGATALFVAAGQHDDFVAFADFLHFGLLTALREPATRSS